MLVAELELRLFNLQTCFQIRKSTGSISHLCQILCRNGPCQCRLGGGDVLNIDLETASNGTLGPEIFTSGELDYVFGRMLFLRINWVRYFENMSRSLSSGGIVEHQDLDWKFYRVGTSECLSNEWEWHKLICKQRSKPACRQTLGLVLRGT